MRERTVATYVVAAASVIFYAVIHGDVSAWWLATIPVMWFIGTLIEVRHAVQYIDLGAGTTGRFVIRYSDGGCDDPTILMDTEFRLEYMTTRYEGGERGAVLTFTERR